jgi:hypothetical protein
MEIPEGLLKYKSINCTVDPNRATPATPSASNILYAPDHITYRPMCTHDLSVVLREGHRPTELIDRKLGQSCKVTGYMKMDKNGRILIGFVRCFLNQIYQSTIKEGENETDM